MSYCAAGLAALARHPAVVLGAYASVFYPFLTMYATGPLVGRSTPRLRRGQWRRIILTFPALLYVSFYAHLQHVAHDYKEMSAAAVAAAWCCLYILRHSYELGVYYWGRLKIEWRAANAPERF